MFSRATSTENMKKILEKDIGGRTPFSSSHCTFLKNKKYLFKEVPCQAFFFFYVKMNSNQFLRGR